MIRLKIKIISYDENTLPGGIGDNTDPDSLDQDELHKGAGDEMEHTNDPEKAIEISTDHLTGNPHYYSDLEKSGMPAEPKLPSYKKNKLSDYWRKRAKRRAINAKRTWPNGKDRKWALEEQERSQKINEKVKSIFEKEFEITEELSSTIEEFLKKAKKNREFKIKTFDGKKRKKPSGPQSPPKSGEGIAGRISKAAKKGPVVAPGAGFGGPGIGE